MGKGKRGKGEKEQTDGCMTDDGWMPDGCRRRARDADAKGARVNAKGARANAVVPA